MNRLRTRRLGAGFETLERRTVLAGNVTAALSLASAADAGILDITGDGAANAIAVFAGALPYQVVVAGGRDAAGNPTLVNGQDRVTISGVAKGIRLNMNAGNDKVVLTKLETTSVPRLSATLGAQADTLILRGNTPSTPDLTLNNAGAISYGPLAMNEGMDIAAGDGNDVVRAFNVQIGTYTSETPASVLFRGGNGNDTFQVDGAGRPSQFEDYPTRFGCATTLDMGAGADFVNLARANFEHPAGFRTSGLTIYDPQVVGDTALTSRVRMFAVDIDTKADLWLNGMAADVDIVGGNASIQELRASSILLQAGSGSQVTVDFARISTLSVETGNGDDDVQITRSRDIGYLAVLLGGGNDELVLGNVRSLTTHLDGGAGTDTYTDQGGNSLGTLTRINFEP